MKKKIPRIICLILPMLLIVTTASGSQNSSGTPPSGGRASIGATEALSRQKGPSSAMYSNVTQIAAGDGHSLVLTSDGSVWAFGNNCYGQLGDGTTTDSLAPVRVAGLPHIAAIKAGSFHNIAVDDEGSMWAWGWNAHGQLGDGTTTDRLAPVQIVGTGDAVLVSAGYDHSLALDSSQELWAWGGNGEGQLGDGTTTDSPTPVLIDASGNSYALSTGYGSSLAPDSSAGSLGLGGDGGSKPGEGLPTGSAETSMMRPPNRIKSISAGYKRSLACRDNGTMYAWGDNWDCQSPWVEQMVGFEQVYAASVIAGTGSNMACDLYGSLWGWGQSWHDWTDGGTSAPIEILEFADVCEVSLGYSHGLALTTGGSVWEWDEGPGTASFSPEHLTELPMVVAVASGHDHYLALDSGGSIWVWGNNDYGQFGDGTTTGSSSPVLAEWLQWEEEEEEEEEEPEEEPEEDPVFETELQLVYEKTYLIAVKAENVPGFQNSTYTLEYNEAELCLIDFAAQTAKLDTGVGPVDGTPLTIVSTSYCKLEFTVDIEVPSGRQWSGMLTILCFKALGNGSTTIKISQST